MYLKNTSVKLIWVKITDKEALCIRYQSLTLGYGHFPSKGKQTYLKINLVC